MPETPVTLNLVTLSSQNNLLTAWSFQLCLGEGLFSIPCCGSRAPNYMVRAFWGGICEVI